MTFAWPHLLWLLALPVSLLVWELVRKRRRPELEHPKILRAEAGMKGVDLAEGSGRQKPLYPTPVIPDQSTAL